MKTCSVDGCNKPHYAKGLCHPHYDVYRHKGTAMPLVAPKVTRTCTIPGCNEKHVGKGYCKKHYQTFAKRDRVIRNPDHTCSIEGCTKLHYAKDFCRSHYAKFIMGKDRGHYDFICSAPGCTKKVTKEGGYCGPHRQKLSRGWGFENGSVLSKLGANNPRWSGGTSQYPNHAKMKRLRKLKLESVGYLCEKCGGKATEVHHLDGTKHNHNLNNLVAVCHKCHINIFHLPHWGRKRKYGEASLLEMSKKLGVSTTTLLKYFNGQRISLTSLTKITSSNLLEAI